MATQNQCANVIAEFIDKCPECETHYKPATLVDASIRMNQLAETCHAVSVASGWWHDVETGEPLERNQGELLALIHSEISEALEGFRKKKLDDHLPHRRSSEVELADAIIRIFDLAAHEGMDLGAALLEKLAFNTQRADHQPANRRQAGGKKF